ncbi:MAG: M48 family metalloprotease [Burkholderiales bacterium]|nr:M48 family metalloprotease [Burkholderiales bacterium]
MTRLALLPLAAALLVPGATAQTLPELGDPAAAELPPHVERRIGETIVRELRLRDPAWLDDPEIVEYVSGLGARLAAAAPGARRDFEFFVVRDTSINAFALPGGFIGVHTGLIAASESESEIASVLAHEMAHVTQRHIARLLAAERQAQLPTLAALAVAILLGRSRPDLASGLATAAQGVAVQASLGYSRDFEREADRIGFQTLAAAGFDVRAMPAFFEKMQRYARLAENPALPSWLRTHPITTERIADAQGRAASHPYRQYVDSAEYPLVRAKIRADAGEPGEAVAWFAALLREGRHASEAAARYGLAQARVRSGDAHGALAEIARLRAAGAASWMVETLEARARAAAGDAEGALGLLRAALARYPQRRPVLYATIELLQQLDRHGEAVAAAAEALRQYPRDARLHQARARSFAALGRRLLAHQAQAEYYLLLGSLPAAIEQLELAANAGDGDFYEQSVVEARLKALRAEHAEELKAARRP